MQTIPDSEVNLVYEQGCVMRSAVNLTEEISQRRVNSRNVFKVAYSNGLLIT
jgi:hypothetical protein